MVTGPTILAVYQNFPTTAAIFQGGKIVAAAHEERFSRVKNEDGHPARAIEYCMSESGLQPQDLDCVALASNIASFSMALHRSARWSVRDYLRDQRERWAPALLRHERLKDIEEVFPEKRDPDAFPLGWADRVAEEGGTNGDFLAIRRELFASWLGVPTNRIRTIEHHRCHAYYSYYASPFRGEPTLALTVDGWGDGLNFTAGVFDAQGSYSRFAQSDECALGRIYRYATLILGMKPNEHEYKVMGLAPYGDSPQGHEVVEVFRQTLRVEGVGFSWGIKPTDSYYWFKERLEGFRFDAIAFGLQRWTEEILMDLVRNAIAQTGVRKVTISGGVAMNVKAMGRLLELEALEGLFIGGTPADDTLALGAAICAAEDLVTESGGNWSSKDSHPLSSMYLGSDISAEDEQAALELLAAKGFILVERPSSFAVAEALAAGSILGRCVGRMEVGQRALGNRSLLADPSFPGVKERINAAIKHRDFWMPFAPIVLDSYAEEYLVGTDRAHCDLMTIGVPTTGSGWDAMPAACHPSDRSARPQVLRRSANPKLYELLEAFSDLTGRVALLNTSFNLHGYPIVRTALEAADVLCRTDLDGLLLPGYLILKH